MNAAGIIFSNLNNNTLSRLTADRTVAAIPFACRYRLIDFALSNMVNADISEINVVANYNFRSLLEHIGSGKDWDLARRSGGINFISPYQAAHTPNAKLYSSHLEALRSITDSYIETLKKEYVILSDADFICNIDLEDVLRVHKEKNADVTVVAVLVKDGFSAKTPKLMLKAGDDDCVTAMTMSDGNVPGYTYLSANIFVLKTSYLLELLRIAEQHDYKSFLRDLLMPRVSDRRIFLYRHLGYFASVSSFCDYFTYSIALTKDAALRASLLGIPERPIFTNVHNSPPVLYRDGAVVRNSMIADGCVIEGTVENSILFRGVKVKKGAVVKNSVLFFGTEVGENTTLNCIIADKHVSVSSGITLSGHETIPFFIGKGRKI